MNAWKRWAGLFDDAEDPAEPRYDPVHLATVLVACQVVIGVLFWLLWTAFVYEGGLAGQLTRLWSGKGPGEGWLAQSVAVAVIAAGVKALLRADRRASQASR